MIRLDSLDFEVTTVENEGFELICVISTLNKANFCFVVTKTRYSLRNTQNINQF